MPNSSSEAVTDVSNQVSQEQQKPVLQRNHTLSGRAMTDSTLASTEASPSCAFPIRVDSPHGDQTTCAPQSQLFFERKYLADRFVGGLLLVLFSPIILALYLIVRATSRGPGFYKQERVGLDGKTFEIFKLRSMVQNAEKPGQAQWAVKGDSRVNLVGRVLRRLHLDELPQLFNVCRGEMSLVGPRPERPQICKDLARQIDGYCNRTAVKPGVTGLAQINLPPDESIDDVRRKQILDLHYIENATLWLDVRMIFATALRMVGVKGYIVTKLMWLDRTCLVRHVGTACEPEQFSPVRLARPSVRSDVMMDSRSMLHSAVAFSIAPSDEDSGCMSYPIQSR